MTWLLSLDPGRQGFGWAAFDLTPNLRTARQDARCRACGVVPQPKSKRDFEAAALQDVAAKVASDIDAALEPLGFTDVNAGAVVERMVLYPGQKTYAANDLLDLQAIGGMVAAALVPLRQITYRRPSEWKGSVDTEVIARRLLETPASPMPHARNPLTVQEQELLREACLRAGYKTPERPGRAHNIVDAAAMGLVEVGRLRLR